MDKEIQNKLDVFIGSLPKRSRNIPKEDLQYLVDLLTTEPELYEDVISYTDIIKEGKWSIVEYLNAVRYVTYQMMGHSNRQSFLKVFPDKIGVPTVTLDKYVNKFNKSKLVLSLQKVATVPLYLTHHYLLNKAIAKQAELMDTAKSEMVKHLAAKELCNILKPPEENYMQIDVNVKKDNSIEAIEQALYSTANKLVQGVQDKTTTTENILNANIIEAEYEES